MGGLGNATAINPLEYCDAYSPQIQNFNNATGAAIVAGALLMQDTAQTVATSNEPGLSTSVFTKCINPVVETNVTNRLYVVAMEAAAIGADFKGCIFGAIDAQVAASTYAKNDALFATGTAADRNLIEAGAVGSRKIAMYLGTAGAVSAGAQRVLFWGGIPGGANVGT